jgi:S-adenosyl-L-methionine hydrolase (adenosine-forming)
MADRRDTISFLSDYGSADEFVGVVKSVVRTIAPHVTVIDLTHEIPPHDVRAGGLALARAVQYLAPGVVLAVVDPGVGTDRRAVAVEVAGGEGVFVGPDNGLLAPAVAMSGGATAAVELSKVDHHLPSPGPTFAGRDIFAPVSALLCNGLSLDDVGVPVDPAGLLPGVLPISRMEGDVLHAEVLWVDRFGNAQLNLDPDELPEGDRIVLTIGGQRRTAKRAPTYGGVGPGEIGLVVDSYGLISVVLDQASAADQLGLGAGDAVLIEAAAGDEGATGAVPPTPVRLRPAPDGRGRS